MKITKFKKYISWNIISIMGYFCFIITNIFLIMYGLASTGLHIRADINEFFYEYIIKHIITPYLELYKFQIIAIAFFLICSIHEKKYYQKNELYGKRFFEEHEKAYSILFSTGLALNFLPLYIFLIVFTAWIMRFIKF